MIWRVCYLDAKVSYKSQLTTVSHQSSNTVSLIKCWHVFRKKNQGVHTGRFQTDPATANDFCILGENPSENFFTIRVAQWIRVPGYQNGYPGSGMHSGTRVPVPSTSRNRWKPCAATSRPCVRRHRRRLSGTNVGGSH
jgi:hypothetical protein